MSVPSSSSLEDDSEDGHIVVWDVPNPPDLRAHPLCFIPSMHTLSPGPPSLPSPTPSSGEEPVPWADVVQAYKDISEADECARRAKHDAHMSRSKARGQLSPVTYLPQSHQLLRNHAPFQPLDPHLLTPSSYTRYRSLPTGVVVPHVPVIWQRCKPRVDEAVFPSDCRSICPSIIVFVG